MNPVYIVDSIRTPRARANQKGGLNKLNPYELLDFLYKDIEKKNFLNLNFIDEVILGCVTQYGEQAGNIAKTSTLFSGYPDSISGLTVNRFCSSSLDAINLGHLLPLPKALWLLTMATGNNNAPLLAANKAAPCIG